MKPPKTATLDHDTGNTPSSAWHFGPSFLFDDPLYHIPFDTTDLGTRVGTKSFLFDTLAHEPLYSNMNHFFILSML